MNPEINYVNINKPLAASKFSQRFWEVLKSNIGCYSNIVVLCIGTDRSTGDSLGPLVGQKLKFMENEKIRVYGTLDEPVHARNLKGVLNEIQDFYKNPFIISIDACLGKADNVGCICVEEGPIKPGAGVNKKLPEVGDIHIMGIVNIGGFMEYIILQNTRLNLVMKMVDIISVGIYHNLIKLGAEESVSNKLVKE